MRQDRRIFLVNPSRSTLGYSFITPRWLFVLAAATPTELLGEPVLVDETLERFRPESIEAGDIVGVSITSGNCLEGYRVLREAKARGATVVVGGIHATIFPAEPIEMGADAVVTGNADEIWPRVLRDALSGRLQTCYAGGRLPGNALLKADWSRLDPRKYMMASVQTVAGCPENCSFCSVWVTDGRQPRLRSSDRIVEEIQELRAMGVRIVVYADDNFAPATWARIARERSGDTRRALAKVREERLRLFEEFHEKAPRDIWGLTQLTSEIVSDEEYMTAVRQKMQVRLCLVGVESFSERGLESINKKWNPKGEEMLAAIRTLQERGIEVLSSIICGIESDTPETLAAMRGFAKRSGACVSQFTIYSPFPGTKDYYELLRDKNGRDDPSYRPRHVIRLVDEKFWLSKTDPVFAFAHPEFSSEALLAESQRSWSEYYSVREIRNRLRQDRIQRWPLAGKLTYLFGSIAFERLFGGRGVSSDSVRSRTLGIWTRVLLRIALSAFNHLSRRPKVAMSVLLVDKGLADPTEGRSLVRLGYGFARALRLRRAINSDVQLGAGDASAPPPHEDRLRPIWRS